MRDAGKQRLWHRLMAAAQEETDALVRALPAPLRKEARAIPLSFEPAPSALLQGDGIAADTLGLFTGEAFPDKYVTAHELPAQIILFLENLWDFAQHDPASYREEVRKTYLHELGHYLGLDEDALVDRDLD